MAKPDKNKKFVPGDVVPRSGIYEVVHAKAHEVDKHEVTCVMGERFPPCGDCKGKGEVSFKLVRPTKHKHEHVRHHEYFKTEWLAAQEAGSDA